MKWFKHYTDASRSEKLAALIDRLGIEGYGRYWLLVELLAEKFDGKDPNFKIHNSTIKRTLYIHHNKMVDTLMLLIDELQLMSALCVDNVWTIYCPKLLEIKDNHTRNLQVASKSVAPRREEKRTDKKRVTKKKSEYDLDLIYAAYPKKTGKAGGLKKLEKIIATDKKYNEILQGAKNYSDLCEDNNTDQQYIKQFSTWVNGEHWNDEIETKSMVRAKLDILEQELLDL